MTDYKSLFDMTAEEWLQAVNLTVNEIPSAVIVEGSWWRQQRTDFSLSYLADVRELPFPDMFWGRWQGTAVIYCCAYGAARAAEPIHIFCRLGARLAIQVGTCLALQPELHTGDIVLPRSAACQEGVAANYGAGPVVYGDDSWIQLAKRELEHRALVTHAGQHLTWACLLGQRPELVAAWQTAGYLSKDMETATTFAVAKRFGRPAVAMLVAWQDLGRNRNFLDPLPGEEQHDLDRGRTAVYEVALALAAQA